MIRLAANTAHINNGFWYHNVGVIMGMSGVQYSGSYGTNLFGTSSTYAPPVDNYTAIAFSVSHTDLNYSEEQNNYRTTNGITCN